MKRFNDPPPPAAPEDSLVQRGEGSIWKAAGPKRDLALGTSGVTAIVLLVSGVPVVVAMAGAGFAGWAMGKALGRIRG